MAKWYHRRGAAAEDPWISLKDHWDDDRTTQLYGEASFGHQHLTLLRQHQPGTSAKKQRGRKAQSAKASGKYIESNGALYAVAGATRTPQRNFWAV